MGTRNSFYKFYNATVLLRLESKGNSGTPTTVGVEFLGPRGVPTDASGRALGRFQPNKKRTCHLGRWQDVRWQRGGGVCSQHHNVLLQDIDALGLASAFDSDTSAANAGDQVRVSHDSVPSSDSLFVLHQRLKRADIYESASTFLEVASRHGLPPG